MRIVTGLLAAVTLVGVCARLLPSSLAALPGLPVIVSATPWFALTAALALALTCVRGRGRRRGRAARRVVACLMALALVLEAFWQLPYFSGSLGPLALWRSGDASAEAAPDASLRVMTCNVYKGRADAKRIVELVRTEGVQVLALQETTTDFVAELEANGLNELLPYSERSSSDGVYGNGVWSSLPLADGESDDIGSSASAMPAGTVTVTLSDGSAVPVRFVSVHTTAPVPGYWDLWRKSIEEIGVVRGRLADDPSRRYVLMGDFNATHDHAPFRDMLGNTLFDAAELAGRGLTMSWPTDRAWLPAFCGIDHVVVSSRISASDMRTVEVAGTDHAALVCTLGIEG